MKKIISILLTAVILTVFLTGCGNSRLLYKNVNLEDYITVGEYKGIEVDTSSDKYAKYYSDIFETDISDSELYNEVSEGAVEDGDIVNLDYEGKLDGVAFDGGTAQGYDLEIGSGTFIDGFEDGLIGAAIGETRDVKATFPNSYQNNPDLAGKTAVFTCKINSIKKPMTEEEAYKKMKFDTAKDYIDNIKERAVKQYLLDVVCNSAKVADYPEKDSEKLTEAIYEFYVDAYKTQYNQDLESLLVQNGSSVEQYKSNISSQMVPSMMNVNMVMYYILDAEELEIYESTLSSQEIDQPIIAESYAVQDIVTEYLYDNAKIK